MLIHAVLPPISFAAAIGKLAVWHTFATAKMAKAAKPKQKNKPFSGAFPKNKMYLFIKFSTRTHIQLEMGLKLANFGPIPSQRNIF